MYFVDTLVLGFAVRSGVGIVGIDGFGVVGGEVLASSQEMFCSMVVEALAGIGEGFVGTLGDVDLRTEPLIACTLFVGLPSRYRT